MKKLAITAALFAAFGISSVSAQSSTQVGGNITFNGAVTNNTCDVSFTGSDIDSFGADGRNPVINLRQSFKASEIDSLQGSKTIAEAREFALVIKCDTADLPGTMDLAFSGDYDDSTAVLKASGNDTLGFALYEGSKNNINGVNAQNDALKVGYDVTDLSSTVQGDQTVYSLPFFTYLTKATPLTTVKPGSAQGILAYELSYE